MKPEQWKKIETICQKAMDLQGEARTTYLQKACIGDKELLEEVQSLLEQEDFEWLRDPLVRVQSSIVFRNDLSESDTVIGPYRLIRSIASGGMGQVYLAVRDDEQFEQFVALKVIRKGLVSQDVLARFYEERQILASLNHPNIGRLFDGGTTEDGLPWFAMEYVEGTPITDYCERHNPSLNERLDLILAVCSAVQYAHQNLVVHRDLKPANILITEEGRPKLLDFGIAKLTDMEQETSQTLYQNRIMTPEYASPEQVKQEPISTVSDVYSLGVLLYELLTGKLPYQFEKRTPAFIEQTVCQYEPEEPSNISGSKILKGDLDNIVMMAMKKNPSERYSSVEQFADDIRRYKNGLPVIARRDSFTYRSQKFLKRHGWSVAVSTLIALLVVTFAITTYIQSETIEERAVEAENQRDRAEQVSNFLIDLFKSVDPSEAKDESLSAVELLHRGADRVDSELSDQPHLQADLYQVVSDVYESLGMYEDGIDMARKALDLQRQLYGMKHTDIAISLNSLGWLYRQLGEYELADSLLQSALSMRREIYNNEDNLEVARTLNDLAVLKQSQGDYTATDTLLSQALEIRRRLLGDNNESVGVTLSNYAALKWRMGDMDSATEMMRESFEVLESNFGEQDMRVTIAMTNLAAMLLTKGDIDGAESLYRKALNIRYQLVGEEHPDVANSLAHLGNLLRIKGEYEEAETLLLKALELRKKLLGEHHVLVGDSYRLLAYLYSQKGDTASAEKYYLSAIETFQSIFPEGHTRTADVQHSLAEIYLEMHDAPRAQPLFRKAMETRQRFYGENDARTAASAIKLGICLSKTGKLSESKLMLTTGMKMLERSGNESDELKSLAENALAGL